MHPLPKLMAITRGTPIELLQRAAAQGIGIQVRERQLDGRELFQYAKAVREITQFLCVNERVDIALAVNADAIHLPEHALSPHIVKTLAPHLCVGVSVHSLAAAQQAAHDGADYIQFGPIFDTPLKGPPQGLHNLSQVCRAVHIPVYAVGGIDPSRLQECLDAGAYGVAFISAIELFI